MLKEMPQVGDKVRFVGDGCTGFLTRGREYEVTGVVGDLIEFVDDDGDELDDDMADWVIVETQAPTPDTAALIANLALRVGELEKQNAQQALEINELYRAYVGREARL